MSLAFCPACRAHARQQRSTFDRAGGRDASFMARFTQCVKKGDSGIRAARKAFHQLNDDGLRELDDWACHHTLREHEWLSVVQSMAFVRCGDCDEHLFDESERVRLPRSLLPTCGAIGQGCE